MSEASQFPSERGESGFEAWLQYAGKSGEVPSHSPVYRMKLAGPTPSGLKALPKDPRPVDHQRGEQILGGVWRFGASKVVTPKGHAPWGPPFPNAHVADCIHRFHWLRDVAGQGDAGISRARALCVSWVDRYGKWEAFAWRVAVTADRLINLLSAGPWLLGGLEPQAREEMLDALARHARHLHLSGDDESDPRARFRIFVALALAGAAMDMPDYVETGLAGLERECARQILADGGHASRSPEALAETMIDLSAVEDLMLRLGLNAPAFLTKLLARMAPMLSFFTFPGGGLPPVNGGGDGAGGLSAAALAGHGDVAARFSFARLSGFQKITADRLTVLMDTGAAPELRLGGRAHAGILGLQIFDGAEALVTSCGAHTSMEPALREAARRTPAHSTLTLDGLDSAEFELCDDTGLRAPVGPDGVSARRLEENDQHLIEGQHAAWRASHGLLCRRRIYVSRDGARITGEDSLSRPVSETAPVTNPVAPYAIRFHLHPDVEVAPGPDDRTVFLGLPREKKIWRFRAETLPLVQDSRYWGAGGAKVTKQIVVAAEASALGDGSKAPNRMRWAFSRVDSVA